MYSPTGENNRNFRRAPEGVRTEEITGFKKAGMVFLGASGLLRKINLPANEKSYDKSETTVGNSRPGEFTSTRSIIL